MMSFKPRFTITPAITKALLEIERHKEAIEHLPFSASMLASLRESARLMSTHYSTQIEGNQLSPKEVEKVVKKNIGGFPGRERDEMEVKNYYKALEVVESLASSNDPIKEKDIQCIHSLILKGKTNPTPYRDGQNVIQDSMSGAVVYMPPEYTDVPQLMEELVRWINQQVKEEILPVAIIGAIAHYQYATIHPYYDGNGRTARLLTTLILHKCGYDLKGIYSLEEYYAKNLKAYYNALDTDNIPNYYMGRKEANITPFLEYFCSGMAISFRRIRTKAEQEKAPDQSKILRQLSARQKQALSLFNKQAEIKSSELASHLGIPDRSSAELCIKWVEDGFLKITNPSKKARAYGLSDIYEKLI